MRKRSTLISSLLLAVSCVASAAEWSQTGAEPAPLGLQFERLLADGDGYVLVGRGDNRVVFVGVDAHAGVHAEVRDANAQLFGNLYAPEIDALGKNRFLLPMVADASSCLVAISDGTGTDLTRARLPRGRGETCGALVPQLDAAGGLWLRRFDSNVVVHIRADGDQRTLTAPMGTPFAYSVSPLLDSTSAYILFRDNGSFNLTRASDAGLAWTRVPPITSLYAPQVLTATDGDALLVGSSATTASPNSLFLARYAPDGTLRWNRSYPELAPASVFWVRQIGGDRVVVNTLATLDGPGTTVAFDGNGDLAWSKPNDGDHAQAFVDGADGDPRTAPSNFAYFVYGSAPEGVVAIEYVDRDGVLIRRIPANNTAVALSALLGDGSLVHLGDTGLLHLAPSGTERVVPAIADMTPWLAPVLHEGHAASNGESYTLVQRSDGAGFLRAWSASGTALWQQPIDELPAVRFSPQFNDFAGIQASRLIANDALVCFGPHRVSVANGILGPTFSQGFGCHDRAMGARDFAFQLGSAEALATTLGLAGRQLLTVQASCVNCSGASVSRVEYNREAMATGAVLRRELASGLTLSDRAPLDDAVNLLADYGPELANTVFAGAQRGPLTMVQQIGSAPARQAAIAGEPTGVMVRVERQADGSFLLHSWLDGVHSLRAIGSEGSLRWTRHFSAPLTLASGHPAFIFSGGAGVVVLAEQQSLAGTRIQSHVELLGARGGDSHWQHDVTALDLRGVRTLGIDGARGLALVARDRPGKSVLSTYALTTGALLGQGALPCAASSGCGARSLVPTADGSLRQFGGGSLVSRVELASTVSPARIDQRSLSGAWYNAATNGQGLLIDHSAGTGNLLAAWFGFADSTELGPAGLRWYTLAGNTRAHSDSVELTIYRNQGGAFASVPITSAARVGVATLRMNTCQQAVLSYAFDPSELAGARGEIGLQRLAPLTVDCQNADGSVEPATPAQPAGNGFAAGHSGAWYEPASSGQGLLFDVRPASADGSDPGLLLAGWFTYDPVGAADDPTAQHWFLLQGDFANVENGRVEVPIYRITGGRFDQTATRNVHPVGSAQLEFSACNRGRLSYRFDASDLAGSFAGRTGEIPLTRLLPCE